MRSEWLKGVEQGLAASDYNRLSLAGNCALNDYAHICRWVELWIPSVLCIAPLTPYIATAKAYKIGGLTGMEALALYSIEILY